MTQIDLNRISEILRMLQPRQEKVIRLYFGLGCQRSHSALEIAEAFEVSSQVIAGILGTAERRLARLGLTPIQLRAAARREAELHAAPGARSLPESKPKSWSGHRTHR
jgi:DNA-directed RNA polymerase sigma subunit (sigma70/sigma32)